MTSNIICYANWAELLFYYIIYRVNFLSGEAWVYEDANDTENAQNDPDKIFVNMNKNLSRPKHPGTIWY